MTTNKFVFGIDIGGTTVKCGLFSENGELLEKEEIATRKEEGGSYILSDIANHIQKVLEKRGLTPQDIIGVGLGVPGSVLKDSIVNKCINLGWGVIDVSEQMKKYLPDIPVKAGNDANMAALGEYWQGAAKGYDSTMMVTVGTGVGGGLILNGKAVIGFNGAAAEIGHMPLVHDESEPCNCGNTGCLEQVSSASGIVRTAARLLQEKQNKTSILRDTRITAKAVFDAAKAGDDIAKEVVEYVCEYLGKCFACVSAVVDPECFLIGGGVSYAGEYFIECIKKYYKKHAFHPSKDTKLLLASLGNNAGMYGAAKLFIE